jgi:hypothetical protein
MIPNIKSSEVLETVSEKVIHAGSESIMFSVLQETQYVYRSNHQSEIVTA